jgi:uncharacterized protein YecT (DUF1311 family)
MRQSSRKPNRNNTIARIDAGDCMVETTKRRAIELEEAGERK